MDFSVWPSPQHSWADVLDVAQHAATTGWHGVWFADHFMPMGDDVSAPMLECWSVLAGLAAVVPDVRLGALVSGNTYRHPAVLANQAMTVDHISNGRCVLGLGAGWQENEHRAYGIEFFDVKGRLDRFEEACEIVTRLLREERTTFEGRFYALADAPLEPKPVQRPLPLLVGGGGEKRTLRIAARFADEWNVWGTPEVFAAKRAILRRHCEDVGRDPAAIRTSTQAMVWLSTDEAFVADKRATTPPGRPVVIGTPAEVVDTFARYAEAGVDEFIVPDWTMGTGARRADTLDLLRTEVAPNFA